LPREVIICGKAFDWGVVEFEVTAQGKPELIGLPMLCRSEEEAQVIEEKLAQRRSLKPETMHPVLAHVPSAGIYSVCVLHALKQHVFKLTTMTARSTGRTLVQEWSKDEFLPFAAVLHRQVVAESRDAADKIVKEWDAERKAERRAYEAEMAKTPKPMDEFPNKGPANSNPVTQDNVDQTDKARRKSATCLHPHVHAAWDANADAQAVIDAYLIDTAALSGKAHCDSRRSDPNLDREIHAALIRHSKQKTKRGWARRDYLFSWLWPKMIFMSSEQGAKFFNKAVKGTGIKISRKDFRNLRDKLKLTTRRWPGPDPN